MLVSGLKTMRMSEVALVFANILVFILVVLSGENPIHIVFVYWAETAVIGFFWILRMVYTIAAMVIYEKKYEYVVGGFFMVPFFSLHFGGFMLGHLVFLMVFFGPHETGTPISVQLAFLSGVLTSLGFTIIFLILSHGISFYFNFIRTREYLKQSDPDVTSPYGRVIVMHILIFVFAFLMGLLPQAYPFISAVIIVSVKTYVDLLAHRKEHKFN